MSISDKLAKQFMVIIKLKTSHFIHSSFDSKDRLGKIVSGV